MNESLRNLEEKIAYLERHVTEQDKAMLELAEELALVRRELKVLRLQRAGGPAGDDAGPEPAERPPHY
jgi:SlyX protein